jgi:hypothetical protein
MARQLAAGDQPDTAVSSRYDRDATALIRNVV